MHTFGYDGSVTPNEQPGSVVVTWRTRQGYRRASRQGRGRHGTEASDDGRAGGKRGTTRDAEATPPAAPERRFVDIDPWAVLLEQLTEVPEESVPAGRKGGKRE
jgi:hypothetical protein